MLEENSFEHVLVVAEEKRLGTTSWHLYDLAVSIRSGSENTMHF